MEFALLVWFVEVFSSNYYIIDTSFYIGVSLPVFILITLIAVIASADCSTNSKREDIPFYMWWDFFKYKVFKPWAWGLGFIFIANMFGDLMPNKDAAYKIAAAYGVQQAYEAASASEDVKRMAGKSLRVLETSMDRYLNDGLAAAAGITTSSAAQNVTDVVTEDDVKKVKDAAVNRLVDTLKTKPETGG